MYVSTTILSSKRWEGDGGWWEVYRAGNNSREPFSCLIFTWNARNLRSVSIKVTSQLVTAVEKTVTAFQEPRALPNGEKDKSYGICGMPAETWIPLRMQSYAK